jgi:hypothetical protein
MCNDRSQLACGAGHPRVSADCQSGGQIQKAHGWVGTLKKCRDRVFLTATNENWCQMICNIRDYREHHFRWECIRAIVEPAWYHKSRPDSDRAEIGPDALDDDRREGIPPADALAGANALPDRVTLYLYAAGLEQPKNRSVLCGGLVIFAAPDSVRGDFCFGYITQSRLNQPNCSDLTGLEWCYHGSDLVN